MYVYNIVYTHNYILHPLNHVMYILSMIVLVVSFYFLITKPLLPWGFLYWAGFHFLHMSLDRPRRTCQRRRRRPLTFGQDSVLVDFEKVSPLFIVWMLYNSVSIYIYIYIISIYILYIYIYIVTFCGWGAANLKSQRGNSICHGISCRTVSIYVAALGFWKDIGSNISSHIFQFR